jgi:spore maturation protein SpmA
MTEIIDENPDKPGKRNSFLHTFLLIWFGLLLLGVIFKILHFPGANFITLFSIPAMTATAISGVITERTRTAFNILMSIVGMLVLLSFATAMGDLQKMTGLGGEIFLLYGIIFIITFAICEVIKRKKSKN